MDRTAAERIVNLVILLTDYQLKCILSIDSRSALEMTEGSREMEAKDYLEYIARTIHTTIVATVDDEGLPVTAAIDMMDADENGLYFLTAKGKGFYDRLIKRGYLSLTAMKGEDTMSSVAISVRGKVRCLGPAPIPALMEKNPYMYEIYPTRESMSALEAFHLYEGAGEWFDLSKKPVERASFTFGGAKKREEGYFVTDNCIGCGRCYSKCPQRCIDISRKPAVIHQEHCLHCGNCLEICPAGAIVKNGEA